MDVIDEQMDYQETMNMTNVENSGVVRKRPELLIPRSEISSENPALRDPPLCHDESPGGGKEIKPPPHNVIYDMDMDMDIDTDKHMEIATQDVVEDIMGHKESNTEAEPEEKEGEIDE